MPTNETPNYHLNQWVRSDRILMEDFNADNAKIDAALQAEAEAQTALAKLVENKADKAALETEIQARTGAVSSLSAAVGKLGNCKVCCESYTGTGTFGQANPTTRTFPGKPYLVAFGRNDGAQLIMLYGAKQVYIRSGNVFQALSVSWTENSVSFYSSSDASVQMNGAGAPYVAVALVEMK